MSLHRHIDTQGTSASLKKVEQPLISKLNGRIMIHVLMGHSRMARLSRQKSVSSIKVDQSQMCDESPIQIINRALLNC